MDRAGAKAHYAPEGVSVRNGPILDDKMDVHGPSINGAAKRKARVSAGKAVNYNVDESESSDDVPLVWPTSCLPLRLQDAIHTCCCKLCIHRADEEPRPSVKRSRRKRP
jgi:DNA topoisomerase-1